MCKYRVPILSSGTGKAAPEITTVQRYYVVKREVQPNIKSTGLEVRTSVQILALLYPYYVILRKFLNPSKSCFPYG